MEQYDIEIVQSDEIFNEENMHLSLLLYGFYCYHDEQLKDIVPKNIEWSFSPSIFGKYAQGICEEASKILEETQFHKYKIFSPDLKIIRSNVYLNIENGVGVWHNDDRENLTMQALCYQTDFDEKDGGSLQVRCHDGIERHYYPKNGDIVLLNHKKTLWHKIDAIKTDKERIVINLVMR